MDNIDKDNSVVNFVVGDIVRLKDSVESYDFVVRDKVFVMDFVDDSHLGVNEFSTSKYSKYVRMFRDEFVKLNKFSVGDKVYDVLHNKCGVITRCEFIIASFGYRYTFDGVVSDLTHENDLVLYSDYIDSKVNTLSFKVGDLFKLKHNTNPVYCEHFSSNILYTVSRVDSHLVFVETSPNIFDSIHDSLIIKLNKFSVGDRVKVLTPFGRFNSIVKFLRYRVICDSDVVQYSIDDDVESCFVYRDNNFKLLVDNPVPKFKVGDKVFIHNNLNNVLKCFDGIITNVDKYKALHSGVMGLMFSNFLFSRVCDSLKEDKKMNTNGLNGTGAGIGCCGVFDPVKDCGKLLDSFDSRNLSEALKQCSAERASSEVLKAKELFYSLSDESDALARELKVLSDRKAEVDVQLKKFRVRDSKTKK